MNEYEENLIILVHFLSQGNKSELGMDLKDIKWFLTTPIHWKNNRNALQCLKDEGLSFINELKAYVNALE